MRACWRCHSLSETVQQYGLLWLCSHCKTRPACGEYQHAYVGSETPGSLVCLTCGNVLTAGPLRTDVVPAPSQDTWED